MRYSENIHKNSLAAIVQRTPTRTTYLEEVKVLECFSRVSQRKLFSVAHNQASKVEFVDSSGVLDHCAGVGHSTRSVTQCTCTMY